MSDIQSKKIYIIIGSTRPGRVGHAIANWVHTQVASITPHAELEVIDLADWKLPLLDEPLPARTEQYSKPHTKDWSAKIQMADGFIFVTPEYNAGYPGGLKNAIDYLYKEWTQKPAAIVSYGVRGGQTASGQLRQVLERLGMSMIAETVAITLDTDPAHGMFTEDNKLNDPNTVFAAYSPDTRKLVHALQDVVSKDNTTTKK